MTELDPHAAEIARQVEIATQDKMDSLLRRSLPAPVPILPPDFDQRLMRQVMRDVGHSSPGNSSPNQRSQPLHRYRRILLAGYGLTSVVVSAVVMRGQGLGWGAISVMILSPLALLAAARWARRPIHITGHGAN
jgi:hypothetical protein